MKIIITENKVERLKDLIKTNGVNQVIDLMGGWDTFCKVMNIESPMDFLHLFDDLEEFQSTENTNFLLYRYRPGKNIMIYNIKENRVGISDNDILAFVTSSNLFSSSHISKRKGIIQTWLNEVYNLDFEINRIHLLHSWDEISRIE